MPREWKRRIGALASAATALVVLAISAAPAAASDAIYFYAFERPTISRAGLDKTQTGDLAIPGGIPSNVHGIAIDAVTGRIYWNLGNTIEFANLDGSGRGTLSTAGAVLSNAVSLAIDTAQRRLYWANSNPIAPTIGFASLGGSGSGSGNLEIVGATRPTAPLSLLVDPDRGRIYWADLANNRISFAKLDGSGGGDLDTTGAPIAEPAGLAIDAASQRIYWSSRPARAFGSASLAGGDGEELPLLGTAQRPLGVAIDPEASRLYWSADKAPSMIGSIPFPAGGPSAPLFTSTSAPDGAFNPILLKKPTTFGLPVPVSPPRTVHPGDRAACFASWAADAVEANLMRAPQTFAYEWLRNGVPIPGATEQAVLVTEPGTYTCSVTATNFAGSTTQTGVGFTATPGPTPPKAKPRLELVKVTSNRRKGTATLKLMVSGAGKLEVRGRKLAPVNRTTTGNDSVVAVTLRPRGKAALRLLARRGVLKTTANVNFSADGESRSLSTRVVLKKTKPRR
ncbi:MAG TPA: hypothetical protein VFX45_00200 [Solirubrobacterales bacterium]|nr:hypothetical protein [Solirubrobacterales bacterium]